MAETLDCRGTRRLPVCHTRNSGLSPRVPGNRTPLAVRSNSGGSIPASAGEPPLGQCPSWPAEVYPRESGVQRDHVYRDIGVSGATGTDQATAGTAWMGASPEATPWSWSASTFQQEMLVERWQEPAEHRKEVAEYRRESAMMQRLRVHPARKNGWIEDEGWSPPDLRVLRASGAHRVLVVGEAAADRSTGPVPPPPTPSIRDLRPDRPLAGQGAASPPLRMRPGRVLRIPPDAAEPSCNQGLKPPARLPSLILNTQQMHIPPWL